jgi:glyoxylase-like metal-dependent hydrolase (beta-lactamase superfamily II)
MEIEVVFTPGHSPGHLTYAISPSPRAPKNSDATQAGASEGAASDARLAHDTEPQQLAALLSGDVLFQGSVGRVDLPGGDWPTLERSIGALIERFPLDSTVFPGHMGITTLRRELQSNPFLTELRAAQAQALAPQPTLASQPKQSSS